MFFSIDMSCCAGYIYGQTKNYSVVQCLFNPTVAGSAAETTTPIDFVKQWCTGYPDRDFPGAGSYFYTDPVHF